MAVADKPELDKSKMGITSALSGAVAGKQRAPALTSEIQAQIGRKLIAVYDDVLQQPVPDRFRQLLDELDAKTAKPTEKGAAK